MTRRLGVLSTTICLIPKLSGYLKFMKAIRWMYGIRDAFVRGVFPHEMSVFLELRVAKLYALASKARCSPRPHSHESCT